MNPTRCRALTMADLIAVPKRDCPIFIQSERPTGVLSALIKAATNGPDSHSMILMGEGKVATQGWVYRLADIQDFSHCNMTVWWSYKWSLKNRAAAMELIRKRLALPWYKKRYDILGIIGQRLGLPDFNIPYLRYCSEDVAAILAFLDPHFRLEHPSPNTIREWFIKSPHMDVMGRYEAFPNPKASA